MVILVETILTQYAKVLQKIYWYAYVQILWVIFTIMGLIIFGIFPATHALLKVMNQQDSSSSEIFHEFKQAYRVAFFAINRAAIIWFTMIILLSANLMILPGTQQIIKLIAASMICLLVLCIVHFFHYFRIDESAMKQIKRSFAYTCLHPKQNVGYACIILMLGASILFIPGITCFFGVSVSIKGISYVAQGKRRDGSLASS